MSHSQEATENINLRRISIIRIADDHVKVAKQKSLGAMVTQRENSTPSFFILLSGCYHKPAAQPPARCLG